MSTPTPKPPKNPAPHVLHVTPRGVHLHWKPGTAVDEIQAAGRAARAYAGPDLVHAASDPVKIRHQLGMFRFGVDTDGNAIVGTRLADA